MSLALQQDIGSAEKSLKTLTHRDQSPTKLVSKYQKFNQSMEHKAKEEVHRRLARGEMSIKKENSQKRLIAALIQPKQ